MALSDQWKKLQNGSDIRGVAIEGVEGEPVNLTERKAAFISSAFAAWLCQRKNKEVRRLAIAVGTDSRLSGLLLKTAALESMCREGAAVTDCGLASTPAMFMACVLPDMEYDGSIMITASHLPYNRNGMKFFTKDGGLEKGDITSILEIAQSLEERGFAAGDRKPDSGVPSARDAIRTLDLISIYARDLRDKIRNGIQADQTGGKPLEGLKIIVDAGNGAGGFFAKEVLQPLGADTTGSQFLEPDGHFPNHVPNPEDETAMKSIQNAVLANHADFGIIFDTDVDRAGAVDKTGKEINRNRIIALMASIVLEEHPGSTVVTDSITSTELKEFIEGKLHGKHHRFKRGYRNVINESIRLNSIGVESHLAIETSGHGALKENYFMDDGAYLIAKMLIKIADLKTRGETIDSLVDDLAEPVESKEFRFKIRQPDFKIYGEQVLKGLLEFSASQEDWMVAPENYEGVRVSIDKNKGNGWFLLRMSLHDPLMPLNIESNNQGGVKEIAGHLLVYLKGCRELDLTDIEDYCR
jgi:phosphomannomutase